MSPTSRASRRRRPAAVTIHDVAARAGVSVATVSRVLNRKTPVREETSRQVLEVARSLRYVPNVAARSLSIRRSHTIGIVLPEVHGDFFSEVIRGIDLAARRAGYHILVSGSHSDRNEMLEVLAAMRGRVDGLIVMSPDVALSALHDQLADQLPLVLLNSVAEGHTAITIDNYGGAHAMMRHLGTLGHSRIAFIKGPDRNADASERLRGYRHAMRQIGGRAADLEIPGEFSEESGYAAAAAILAVPDRPTAIFAANDAMAVGVLSALSECGFSVPRDLSVAGFDDIPIARYLAPPLTTVKVDMAELGRRAFELLFESIAGEAAHPPRHECVPTSLVVRQSCSVPNAAGRASKPSAKLKSTR
jgi:LacI family transcriptional regulator